MRTIIAFVVSASINWSTIPALALECASTKDVDASRSRWTNLRHQAVSADDKEKLCRAYAASFYESVKLRQAAVNCAEREQALAVLDSEVNAFNDLLATKCGG
jgi:hypothetical protein